jgi:hypothetical protein
MVAVQQGTRKGLASPATAIVTASDHRGGRASNLYLYDPTASRWSPIRESHDPAAAAGDDEEIQDARGARSAQRRVKDEYDDSRNLETTTTTTTTTKESE